MPQAIPKRSMSPTESSNDHWSKSAPPITRSSPGRKYCSRPLADVLVRLCWLMVIKEVSRSFRAAKLIPAERSKRSPACNAMRPILP